MNKNKIITMFINISIALLGLWIFLNPSIGIDFFRFYLGIILLIGALSLFLIYKTQNTKATKLLAQSIILLILGLFFIFSNRFSMITLGLGLSFWMIFEAFMNMNLALTYRKYKISIWPIVLILAIVALITAIYILANLSLSAVLMVRVSAVFVILRSLIIIVDDLVYKKVYLID